MGTVSSEPGEAPVGTATETEGEAQVTAATIRRRLAVGGLLLAVAAASHLVDHAIRGEIVADHNLNPEWNHSGWPFTDDFTPFTPSLVIPIVFLLGAVFTFRGRLWARFWLAWAAIAAAIVVIVHFVPGPQTETLGVIYRTYARGVGNRGAGLLAAAGVLLIVAGLVTLIVLAVRARRLPERS